MRGADGQQQIREGRSIRRFRAAMGVCYPTRSVQNKVAAQLQQVLAWTRTARPPTAEDQTQVAQDHPGAQDRGPRRSFQPKRPIGRALGIGNQEKGKRSVTEESRDGFGWGKANGQHVATSCADFRIAFRHLAEVGTTGHSGEVTQKNEQERPGGFRQGQQRAVRPHQG